MAIPKSRARKGGARQVKKIMRTKGVYSKPPSKSHGRSWRQLGVHIEGVIKAYEKGKPAGMELDSLDSVISEVKGIGTPKNLKPNQIQDRITHIRTSFNLKELERRINMLVVNNHISMEQRKALMERIHKANQLREEHTIRLASMSPQNITRPTMAEMGPDFLPDSFRSHVPGPLKSLYERTTKRRWPVLKGKLKRVA